MTFIEYFVSKNKLMVVFIFMFQLLSKFNFSELYTNSYVAVIFSYSHLIQGGLHAVDVRIPKGEISKEKQEDESIIDTMVSTPLEVITNEPFTLAGIYNRMKERGCTPMLLDGTGM